ncbi:hypothetical protein GWA01_10820 [Gluconobacter wancherniae NBRC 103581]|uniref:Uncharacterized protein n=1 Tax=Gluconobacter wancherniae NBRC 103581 TaxID=656744 RepID=A0A511B0I3_9PROT|nr:hypothetical protein AA103581_2197 [Gluconobacter wancherniae NBRC 103581]GEK93312.1 hypothetical protein GWA01_10820 [Gluconobacter wancherniae NBRC 103581]
MQLTVLEERRLNRRCNSNFVPPICWGAGDLGSLVPFMINALEVSEFSDEKPKLCLGDGETIYSAKQKLHPPYEG